MCSTRLNLNQGTGGPLYYSGRQPRHFAYSVVDLLIGDQKFEKLEFLLHIVQSVVHH